MDIKSEEFKLMLEAAAEKGAKKALADVGLSDEEAIHDVHELRDLLDGWREVKKAVGQTVAKFLTTLVLAAIAAALAVNVYTTGE
jgi:hypothetical protein